MLPFIPLPICAPEDGWRSTKRKRKEPTPPTWRQNHKLDFVFENPSNGKFWQTDAVNLLRGTNTHEDVMTVELSTTYCKHGFQYRKPTTFITSLVSPKPQLRSPCCNTDPCAEIQEYGKHRQGVQGTSASKKNSIPTSITTEFLEKWMQKCANMQEPPDSYVFIDAFAGFGSVSEAVRTYNDARREEQLKEFGYFKNEVKIVENDAFRSCGWDEDMSNIEEFLRLLSVSTFQADGGDNVAMLLWLSTPCETYSTASGSYYRSSKSSGSVIQNNKATEHDEMNFKLAAWLVGNALTKTS
jgi:hypothetical protein